MKKNYTHLLGGKHAIILNPHFCAVIVSWRLQCLRMVPSHHHTQKLERVVAEVIYDMPQGVGASIESGSGGARFEGASFGRTGTTFVCLLRHANIFRLIQFFLQYNKNNQTLRAHITETVNVQIFSKTLLSMSGLITDRFRLIWYWKILEFLGHIKVSSYLLTLIFHIHQGKSNEKVENYCCWCTSYPEWFLLYATSFVYIFIPIQEDFSFLHHCRWKMRCAIDYTCLSIYTQRICILLLDEIPSYVLLHA